MRRLRSDTARETWNGRPEGRPPDPQYGEYVPKRTRYLSSQVVPIWWPQS